MASIFIMKTLKKQFMIRFSSWAETFNFVDRFVWESKNQTRYSNVSQGNVISATEIIMKFSVLSYNGH